MMLEQLQEIFDWIYMQSEPESLTVHLGIWDAGETPYTFFAVVTNQNGAHILGEASYGCGTLDDFIVHIMEDPIGALDGATFSERDATIAELRAEIAALRAQVEELIAGALVRAHRQCIAVEALTAIRDLATNEEMRRIAQNAVAQIGEVLK